MGCSFSTPVTKSNGVPTSGELAKATPSRATPKVPVPQAPPKDASEKSPFELILDLTIHKPADASDVTDVQAAKDEIALVRIYAKEILDSMSAFEGDVSENATDDTVKESNRGAIYEKQDVANYHKISYPKSEEVKALIYDAIRPNALFENDQESELIDIIDLFQPINKKKGECIINEGDEGDKFYVVESGGLSIEKHIGMGQIMNCGTYSKGSAFGEIALMFDSPRAATITATTDVKLWSIDRQTYRLRIGQLRFLEREERINFLRGCTIQNRAFNVLFDSSQIEDLVCVIKNDTLKQGSVLIREGEVNDTLYIVKSGRVDRFQQSQKVGSIQEGEGFGINALLKPKASPETVVAATDVNVYYLTYDDFESMVGSMEDVLDGKSVSRRTMLKVPSSRNSYKTSMTMDQRYTNVSLTDLKLYNVLGRGAFGKVFLVQSKSNKKVFALKAQSKHNILRKGKADHILNEYRIMKMLDHPNILGIHCALQDNRYLFFLLDLHPGGELMTYLKQKRRFAESITRFYAASVLLAFEELHLMMIAYRDLKPENVVLDKDGYGILVDYGLAKEIEDGCTYTLCGTPDYLAPEIIRGTGYDWAVDFWTLGVFLFELTSGRAPFFATNDSRRARKILKGYEFVDVPTYFSRGLKDLIAQLLENNPSRRLGRAQLGIQAIKKHIFFEGFDWEGELCRLIFLVAR